MSDYQPIDCSLHDRIEDLATRRQRVVITYSKESGEVVSVEDDFRLGVRDGVEFLQAASDWRFVGFDCRGAIDCMRNMLNVRTFFLHSL